MRRALAAAAVAAALVTGVVVHQGGDSPQLYVTVCHWTGSVAGPAGGPGTWEPVSLGHRAYDGWHKVLGYYPPDQSKWEPAQLTAAVPGHEHDAYDYVVMNDQLPLCAIPGAPLVDMSMPWIAQVLYNGGSQQLIPQCGCLTEDEWRAWGDAQRGRESRLKYAVFTLRSIGE